MTDGKWRDQERERNWAPLVFLSFYRATWSTGNLSFHQTDPSLRFLKIAWITSHWNVILWWFSNILARSNSPTGRPSVQTYKSPRGLLPRFLFISFCPSPELLNIPQVYYLHNLVALNPYLRHIFPFSVIAFSYTYPAVPEAPGGPKLKTTEAIREVSNDITDDEKDGWWRGHKTNKRWKQQEGREARMRDSTSERGKGGRNVEDTGKRNMSRTLSFLIETPKSSTLLPPT